MIVQSKSSGYTLVELLVVLTLLVTVASMLAPNLYSTSRLTQSEKLIADLVDLDARARVLSGKHYQTMILSDASTNQIQLTVVDDKPLVLHRIPIPVFAKVELDHPVERITFDRFGRSESYGYRITLEDSQAWIRVNGLTGWHTISKGIHQ